MKLLLDENLPKKLKVDLNMHESYTVRDMGWNGKRNGELIKLMLENGFDCLITFDKNLQYQQNLSKYPIKIVVFHTKSNSYPVLKEKVPQLIKILGAVKGIGVEVIE